MIGIGDIPEDADRNAWDARAVEARQQTMAKLIAGHAVEVIASLNSAVEITLRVGDVEFSDKRDSYPSEALVANVSLAVDAQKFNPDAFKIPDFDAEDLRRFDPFDPSYHFVKEELNSIAKDNVRRVALGEPR